jgi:hypothetical protein
MGAKAITEILLTQNLNLEENQALAEKIKGAFMKQVESENFNVHAHAIKCLADILPKLPAQQSRSIF